MQLQGRIVIMMTESIDKPFYYTKDHDEIKNILGFEPDSTGNWDLEIGRKLIIRNVECIIKGFELRVFRETNEPHNYGINLHRAGENYPYNIDIVIYVNDEAIVLRNI